MQNIDFRLIKTSEIDHGVFTQLANCFASAFNETMNYEYFKWKYMDNPLGDSFHLLGYINEQLCLTRNFWRIYDNDELLQCVDTAVHQKYQGMGLFGKSVKYMDDNHPNFKYYNYPNPVSIKQYLKYGWKVKRDNKIAFGLANTIEKLSIELHWNAEQAKWRYENNPKQRYSMRQKNSKYYIFGYRKMKYPVLLGYTHFPLNLPRTNHYFCFSYDDCTGINTGKRAKYISRNSGVSPFYYMFDMS